MLSIGQLSKQTDVKIATIRYYEDVGLMTSSERTQGNQRRYDSTQIERLSFIKHARELGFSLDAISALINLQEYPDWSCQQAFDIARGQLTEVRMKVKQLKALEKELNRIVKGCEGDEKISHCYVLTSLANHDMCGSDHK